MTFSYVSNYSYEEDGGPKETFYFGFFYFFIDSKWIHLTFFLIESNRHISILLILINLFLS